jgi:hypothetical protein
MLYISAWLLDKKAPLLSLLQSRSSPVVLVQQLFANLVTEVDTLPQHTVLRRQTASSGRAALELLAEMTIRASASLHLRFDLRFAGRDYQLLKLADKKLNEADRCAIEQDSFSVEDCCLPADFARPIRRFVIADCGPNACFADWVRCLRSPKWSLLLAAVAEDLDMHTADVECAHALHKHFCRDKSTMGIESVAAQSVLHHASKLHQQAVKPANEGARAEKCRGHVFFRHQNRCNFSIMQG